MEKMDGGPYEHAEEKDFIEEFDEDIAQPLIKRVTIMSLQISSLVLTGVILGVTLPALADPADVAPGVTVEEESKLPAWMAKGLDKVKGVGAGIKENVVDAGRGIFSADEKLKRAEERIDLLSQRNADLQKALDKAFINADIDHRVAVECSEQVTLYLHKIGGKVNE